MARIIDEKLLFIHVAKTGGTFIREAFNHFGIKNRETGDFEIEDHYSLDEVIKNHPYCSKYLSVGFIRHPVDWIQSRWLWAMETNFPAKIKYNDEAKDHWMAPLFSIDVNEFARNIIEKKPGIATDYFTRMLGLGTPLQADLIMKYENMHESIVKIFRILNRSVSIEDIHRLPKFKFVKHKYNYLIVNDLRDQIIKLECKTMCYYE